MGIGFKGCDTKRWVIMTCYRYKEMGTEGTRYVTQRWELMDGDTIYGDGN